MEIPLDDITTIKLLGKGRCGDVFLARSEMFGEVIVKKNLIKGNLFYIITELNSPYVIRHFGTCTYPDGEMIVMEYPSNGSLYNYLQKVRENKIEFKLINRYQIALDIARGLLLLHSIGILHRNIKSENVLLDENMKAKIADFELSVIKTQSKLTSRDRNDVNGTLLWKAPETFFMGNTYSEKSDIYSLGVVFWEIASCEIPYRGFDSEEIRDYVISGERLQIPDSCSRDFGVLICECWKHEPTLRPSIGSIIDKLLEICENVK